MFKRSLILNLLLTAIICSVAFGQAHATTKPLDKKDQELIQSLQDDNLGIRTSAAQLLGERGIKAAADDLMDMLKNDKEYRARIVAGMALLEMGAENAYDSVKHQAEHDKNKTARNVLRGVVKRMEREQKVTFATPENN